MNDDFDWSAAAIEKLTRLWAEGLSTNAIGVAMGISKNSVVGKAHRLLLPPRPSPIRRGGPAATRAPKRAGKVTLASLEPPLPVEIEQQPWALEKLQDAPSIVAPAEAADDSDDEADDVLPIELPAAARERHRSCAYPLWAHAARPDFRFCEAPVAPGKVYCTAHHALCLVAAPPSRRVSLRPYLHDASEHLAPELGA